MRGTTDALCCQCNQPITYGAVVCGECRMFIAAIMAATAPRDHEHPPWFASVEDMIAHTVANFFWTCQGGEPGGGPEPNEGDRALAVEVTMAIGPFLQSVPLVDHAAPAASETCGYARMISERWSCVLPPHGDDVRHRNKDGRVFETVAYHQR